MFLARLARFFANLTRRPWFFFLKHFVYSFVLKRNAFIGSISRSEFIAQLIYWGGTATCNLFRVTTTSTAGTRAGELAVANLALLILGKRFELLSDLLGIQSSTYRRMHQTVGLMTFLQSLVHVLLNIKRGLSLKSSFELYGLLYFLLALRNISASQVGCRAEILRAGDRSAAQIMILLNRPFKIRAVIEGPYGLPVDFIEYDRILMVATGIGIAAQMSYLKELVGMKDEKKSKRTLYVVWEVDKESNVDWVNQWMNQLLLMDKEKCMLKFGIYIPSSSDKEPTLWNSEHDRIWKIPGSINPAKIVGNWWSDNGKALITDLTQKVSAKQQIRDEIKIVAKKRMKDAINIVDLPFQP
uniref:Respiratory burst oxidase like protein D n=1 Tax=Talaromyces marneffei PM1 TaxID=1077442 RepID=A0A093XY46_TALMA